MRHDEITLTGEILPLSKVIIGDLQEQQERTALELGTLDCIMDIPNL